MSKLNEKTVLKFLKLHDKINHAENVQINKSKFNITPIELHVLYVIGSFDFATSSEIANYLNISKPSLSRIIKSLLKKGYIKKEISLKDRRYHYINLTELGKKLFLIYSKLHKTLINIFTKNLSERECEKIEASLNKVDAFLDYLIETQSNNL